MTKLSRKPTKPGLYWYKTNWGTIELINLTLEDGIDVNGHREGTVLGKGEFQFPRLGEPYMRVEWDTMAEWVAMKALENPDCRVEIMLPYEANPDAVLARITEFIANNPDVFACISHGTGIANDGRMVMQANYRKRPRKVSTRNKEKA